MRLLGHPSTINSRKVLWTCVELGLTPVCEDWGGDSASPLDPVFLAINPKGLVPVWMEGDLILTESNTICRYLAAREGRADLLPADPAERARVEGWMDWQATELNGAWRHVFMGRVRNHRAFADARAQEASAAEWNRLMALLDAHLATTGAFVTGAQFTLADIVLALSTNRWEMTPMQRPDLPAVAAWMDRMADRPGFRLHCRNAIP
ncbi:glutathione S-transferase family protein [Pseudooceanicola sp. C21-150M6]|uniref:glutathione S-transferase family protein n=1 Tax=Pseudooceanicola sp. C21-150M6 TaxID=3434355 RepID=UPI003D7F75E6